MAQETAQTDDNQQIDEATPHKNPGHKRPGRPKSNAGAKASGNKTGAKKTAANGNSTGRSPGRPKKAANAGQNAEFSNGNEPRRPGRPKKSADAKTDARYSSRAGGSQNDHQDGARGSANSDRRSNDGFSQSADYAKGFQEFGAGFMSFAQNHMEKSVAAAQQLLNCRSIEDMAQVQSQYLQESFDTMVKEANKMAQNAANFAKKTAEPLSSQMDAIMQKFNGTRF